MQRSVRPKAAQVPSAADAAVTALQTEIWGLVRARFEAQRESRGLTQAALAAQLGVPRTQVCVWLREPGRMTVKAAARMLIVMGAELRCQVEERPAGETMP